MCCASFLQLTMALVDLILQHRHSLLHCVLFCVTCCAVVWHKGISSGGQRYDLEVFPRTVWCSCSVLLLIEISCDCDSPLESKLSVCMYADHCFSSSVSSKLPCSSLKLVSYLTCSDNGFYLFFVAESGSVTKSGILPVGGAFTCNCQKQFKTTFSLSICVQRRKIIKWF